MILRKGDYYKVFFISYGIIHLMFSLLLLHDDLLTNYIFMEKVNRGALTLLSFSNAFLGLIFLGIAKIEYPKTKTLFIKITIVSIFINIFTHIYNVLNLQSPTYILYLSIVSGISLFFLLGVILKQNINQSLSK